MIALRPSLARDAARAAALAAAFGGIIPLARAQPSAPRQELRQPSSPIFLANAETESMLAGLIRGAIPTNYDKREDWGAQKNVTIGLRTEGKGLKTKLKRRKKAVDHGVWKHYRLKIHDAAEDNYVRLERLRQLKDGRFAFTLKVSPKIDFWARAKVYQYGVHLIALEAVGDAKLQLTMDCRLSIRLRTDDDRFGVAVVPRVMRSQLDLHDLQIRRVSNAKGPLVRELGDGVRRIIEHELDGPRLTAKLNRAIEKKQHRLQISAAELLQKELRRLPPRGRSDPDAAAPANAEPSRKSAAASTTATKPAWPDARERNSPWASASK